NSCRVRTGAPSGPSTFRAARRASIFAVSRFLTCSVFAIILTGLAVVGGGGGGTEDAEDVADWVPEKSKTGDSGAVGAEEGEWASPLLLSSLKSIFSISVGWSRRSLLFSMSTSLLATFERV